MVPAASTRNCARHWTMHPMPVWNRLSRSTRRSSMRQDLLHARQCITRRLPALLNHRGLGNACARGGEGQLPCLRWLCWYLPRWSCPCGADNPSPRRSKRGLLKRRQAKLARQRPTLLSWPRHHLPRHPWHLCWMLCLRRRRQCRSHRLPRRLPSERATMFSSSKPKVRSTVGKRRLCRRRRRLRQHPKRQRPPKPSIQLANAWPMQ